MIRKLSLGLAGLGLAAAACAPAPPPPPQPTEFTVNTTADTADFKAGDGYCADAKLKCSLRAAVTEANAQDRPITIRLAPSVYKLTITGSPSAGPATGDLDVTDDLVLEGRGATIDATGLGDRVFDVHGSGSLQARDLTVTGGSAVSTESGGAFRSSTSLWMHHVTATGNEVTGAGASGGAIFNNGGTLVVTNSELSSNTAVRAGGAVEANAGTTMIEQSSLTDNFAGSSPGNGGAFHLTGAGTVAVNRSNVDDNTAASEGGGLWNSAGGTMTVAGTTLTGNIANGVAADNGGGALFNDGGTLTVNTSTVSENAADQGSGSGGGVFNNAGSLTVRNSTLTQNSSARAGGAVETAGGSVVLAGARLENNDTGASPGNGGGLHAGGPAMVNVDRSTVTGNSAALEGGGLWNSALGTMTINRSTVASTPPTGRLPTPVVAVSSTRPTGPGTPAAPSR
ncbi:MAG: CSLREA domain-containing protein [Microthrixaceae bacterium]